MVAERAGSVPLSAKKRQLVWAAMQSIHQELARQGLSTYGLLCANAVSKLKATDTAPYHHVIVDECQDFGPAELALLRALVKPAPDDLFFCGDEGQRRTLSSRNRVDRSSR